MSTKTINLTGKPLIPCDAIQNDFERYHYQHPEVYDSLVKLARSLKEKGVTRYSIKGLMEVVRWLVLDESGRRIKVSNNFTSRYARLLMRQEHDLSRFFVLRGLTA